MRTVWPAEEEGDEDDEDDDNCEGREDEAETRGRKVEKEGACGWALERVERLWPILVGRILSNPVLAVEDDDVDDDWGDDGGGAVKEEEEDDDDDDDEWEAAVIILTNEDTALKRPRVRFVMNVLRLMVPWGVCRRMSESTGANPSMVGFVNDDEEEEDDEDEEEEDDDDDDVVVVVLLGRAALAGA